MSDPFQGPAPPPGAPSGPRSTPIGGQPGSGPPPGFPQAPGPAGGLPGYGQPPPGYGQPPVGQPGWTQPPRRGTNGLAIAGFVLGLLWLCTVGSILGIIFGFVALAQIKSSAQGGRGLAIAGIVLGFVGIAATAAIAIVAVNTADDVLEEDPLERNDVTLVSCDPAPSSDGAAQLEVKNDSSKRSSYLITISFTDTDGRTYIGTDTISGVAAGDAVTASVGAGRTLGDGYRCTLNYVNRFAIAGDS